MTEEQKQIRSSYMKEYRAANKEHIKERESLYREANKETRSAYFKKYKEDNKEHVLETSALYKEIKIEYDKNYRKVHKEKEALYRKSYKETYKSRRNLRNKDRKRNDPIYHLTCNLRTAIKQGFKDINKYKLCKSELILGCSFLEFKKYIENKFDSWMNWGNYGNRNGIASELNISWDLDHIVPISSASTVEEVIKLNHYSNFQPLCSYTNRWIKRNTI